MDYVLGSVAALISGNVTPNRPKLSRRALTPIKHQASPNVTPKSELIEDRSIFLSPTLQKKKAIVKKSPKRIFENPDLDATDSNDGNTTLTSPKAEKVKKHLKSDLDNDKTVGKLKKSPKHKLDDSQNSTNSVELIKHDSSQTENESTPKKKKKKRSSVSNITDNMIVEDIIVNEDSVPSNVSICPQKMKARRKSVHEENEKDNSELTDPETKLKSLKIQNTTKTNNIALDNQENETVQPQKTKNKKRKKKTKSQNKILNDNVETNKLITHASPKKKNKEIKNSKQAQKSEIEISDMNKSDEEDIDPENSSINPNAITNMDSDSEHDSDNEIESENEEINKTVLDMGEQNSSDEEDEEEPETPVKTKKKEDPEVPTEDDIKRTLFVGNVPFSKKIKKEIKKIFSKHGQIQTVRIRTIPIKDGRFTPKMAVIKNELHPDRSTVNVYVKYADHASVEQALVENNTVLNEHHLRVSRSDSTGAEHDPRCSVFVGNLPFALEDETLRAKFEGCGDIVSVRIVRDKKTNAGKGFGYVNFASKDGVELALALSEEDLTIKNRILRVKRCVPPSKQKPGPNRFNKKQGSNESGPNRFNRQQGSNESGPNRFNRNQRPGGPNQNRFNKQVSDGGQRFNRPNGPGPNRFNNHRPEQNRFNRQGDGGNQRQMNQNRGPRQFGSQRQDGNDGAFRRIMNKRPHDGSGDGPPNKKPNINQPSKEKKTRKEFVGMTAEKKKKRKIDKGQKKKKALSEILSK